MLDARTSRESLLPKYNADFIGRAGAGNFYAPTPKVVRPGLSRSQWFAKRVFDLLSIAVILTLFWWLIIIVAIGVRFSLGAPIIFGHRRVGRDGKTFLCYKFRSMVPNADKVLADLLASDPSAREEWDRDFKLKDDPRVTGFGRIIRKFSLDEFPQLWNVLRGDMSIVGPRPVVEDEFERYYEGAYEHYKAVRPGLTGLWQVSGRSDLNYTERVELDRQYVENWGLWQDAMLVFRTVPAMLGRRGAY